MSKNVYIYDKGANQLQAYTTEQIVALDTEKVEELFLKYQDQLAKFYGKLVLNEKDELVYEPFTTRIVYSKKDFYYSELPGDREKIDNEDFGTATVDKEEFAKWDEIRQTQSVNRVNVMYWDGEFHKVTIPEGYKFNNDTKKVEKDISYDLQRLAFSYDPNNIESSVKYNGFPFEVNGNKYLQPFRGVEDRSYYSTLKNDVAPANREVKFFKEQFGGIRDSSSYDIVRGESISDEFLDNMILKMIRYENQLKTVTTKYSAKIQEALDNQNVALAEELIDKKQINIIKALTEEVDAIYK